MNIISYLHCFFIRKSKSIRYVQHFTATLNISLLILINLLALLKIADYFSLLPLVIGVFKRYSTLLTILLFGLLVIINSLFRNKAELVKCLNNTFDNTFEYKNDKWVYLYLVITFAIFLLAAFLLLKALKTDCFIVFDLF